MTISHLVIDFETRSRVDIKKAGMFVYAQDASTNILCAAFCVDTGPVQVWIPEEFRTKYPNTVSTEEFKRHIAEAEVIEAHNAIFEYLMYNNVLRKKDPSWPEIPVFKLNCTAARAAYFSLPRSLEAVGSALSLQCQKDKVGYRIMLKMCKPKADGSWHEKESDFEILVKYCIQDVVTEKLLSDNLGQLPKREKEIWVLDYIINNRGIELDVPSINRLIDIVEASKNEYLLEIGTITKGDITSTQQVAKTIDWLKTKNCSLPDLQKNTVQNALDYNDICQDTRRVLELRQYLSKNSVAKLQAMLNYACEDNRARGTMLYHGCSTGRFSGKGIQPHNFPRETFLEKEIEDIISMSHEEISLIYGDPITSAAKCLRGMIVAGKGKVLLCADFVAIEARVLAWLAGAKASILAFRNKQDLYKISASKIFYKEVEGITKPERTIGKVATLALGYQGWINAFNAMASVYGLEMEEDRIKEIVLAWRESNMEIVNLWKYIEDAAIEAILSKNASSYGPITFFVENDFLFCRLPSGRNLAYYAPLLAQKEHFGKTKTVISFFTVDSLSKKWVRSQTYGGKLVENIVQALARDVLVEALLRVEKAGYPVVFHVHDEVVAEVKEESNKLKDFEQLLSISPIWAKDLPLEAEGYVAKRYRK